MTENNAAQPGLTDDEIRDIITNAHQAYGAFKTGYGLALGRAIESALLSKLRAEGVQAGDERAHHRNEGFSSLSLWWTMIEAEAELIGEPIKNDSPVLSFMGSGASHQVTAGDIRAALASAPVAGEAQPVAYLTLDEEGSPCMLFFDVVEARTYCALGEEPEPLFRHAAPQASEAAWPVDPTPAMIEAMRTGSRKDWPSDELCRVRYAALRSAALSAQPGAQKNGGSDAE